MRSEWHHNTEILNAFLKGEIIGCKHLQLLDPEKIIKGIEFIVQLIPIPQALPKYEKISIINLGYVAWLLTSFELGGKRSFGMPGMP